MNRMQEKLTDAVTAETPPMPPTAEQPTLVARYLQVASIVRRDMWRFDLNKQHRIVGGIILELSFGMGRESVKINRLRVFCDLTGLDRSEISKALDQLQRMRIVNARRIAEVMEYQVEPDSDHWRCQPLLTDKKSLETLEWVEALNRHVLDDVQRVPVEAPEPPANWNE
jgi:hypothetical protein